METKETKEIKICRNLGKITRMCAHLKAKCESANETLQKLKEGGFFCFEMTDEILKGIYFSEPARLLDTIRRSMEDELSGRLGIFKKVGASASMREIESKVTALFAEKADRERGMKFRHDTYETDGCVNYIRYDGNSIVFDAEAIENDNTVTIAEGSAAAEYIATAEKLAREISEFNYITYELGNHRTKGVSSSVADPIIDIDGVDVCFALRNVAVLDFTDAEKVFADAKTKAKFRTSSIDHHP